MARADVHLGDAATNGLSCIILLRRFARDLEGVADGAGRSHRAGVAEMLDVAPALLELGAGTRTSVNNRA
jgi:hypothetical protein